MHPATEAARLVEDCGKMKEEMRARWESMNEGIDRQLESGGKVITAMESSMRQLLADIAQEEADRQADLEREMEEERAEIRRAELEEADRQADLEREKEEERAEIKRSELAKKLLV
jgi:hypothetical protein